MFNRKTGLALLIVLLVLSQVVPISAQDDSASECSVTFEDGEATFTDCNDAEIAAMSTATAENWEAGVISKVWLQNVIDGSELERWEGGTQVDRLISTLLALGSGFERFEMVPVGGSDFVRRNSILMGTNIITTSTMDVMQAPFLIYVESGQTVQCPDGCQHFSGSWEAQADLGFWQRVLELCTPADWMTSSLYDIQINCIDSLAEFGIGEFENHDVGLVNLDANTIVWGFDTENTTLPTNAIILATNTIWLRSTVVVNMEAGGRSLTYVEPPVENDD